MQGMSFVVSVKSVPIRLIRISRDVRASPSGCCRFGQAHMTQASTLLEIRIERIERIERITSVLGDGAVRVGSGIFLVGNGSSGRDAHRHALVVAESDVLRGEPRKAISVFCTPAHPSSRQSASSRCVPTSACCHRASRSLRGRCPSRRASDRRDGRRA